MHNTGPHASDYGCHSFNLGLKLQMPSGGKDRNKKNDKAEDAVTNLDD